VWSRSRGEVREVITVAAPNKLAVSSESAPVPPSRETLLALADQPALGMVVSQRVW